MPEDPFFGWLLALFGVLVLCVATAELGRLRRAAARQHKEAMKLVAEFRLALNGHAAAIEDTLQASVELLAGREVAEAKLLDAAEAAIGAGRRVEAIRLLEHYKRHFRDGLLLARRDALWRKLDEEINRQSVAQGGSGTTTSGAEGPGVARVGAPGRALDG